MKKLMNSFNKKTLTLILTAVFFTTAVFAFEWGGTVGVTESTKNTIDHLSFKQGADASLWFRQVFSKNLTFAGDVLYFLDYDFAEKDFNLGAEQKLDLNSFFLKGNYQLGQSNWDIGFSIGRFIVADATSLILSQKVDGAGVSFNSDGSYSLKLYAGYTGLLNSKTNKMYAPYFEDKNTLMYSFDAPYIITGFSTKFTSLFASQNLSAEILAAIDQKMIYNQIYCDIALDGPIYKSLYYALAASYESILNKNAENFFDWGLLAKAEIMYFFKWNSLTLDANVVYMTEDFTPITQQEAMINGAYYNSIMKTGFTTSAKFCNVLFVALGLNALFDVDSYTPNYYGLQYDVALRYQILDDLQASVSASQLFYADPTQPSFLCVKGSVRLSF